MRLLRWLKKPLLPDARIITVGSSLGCVLGGLLGRNMPFNEHTLDRQDLVLVLLSIPLFYLLALIEGFVNRRRKDADS